MSCISRARDSGSNAITAAAQQHTTRRIGESNPQAPRVIGDAQQMGFEDAAFDRTLSLLVVNFIPDATKAVNEMKRVTRRGGTIAAAVWDYGDGMDRRRAARCPRGSFPASGSGPCLAGGERLPGSPFCGPESKPEGRTIGAS
jgi:SAM-dependent methyltransferase